MSNNVPYAKARRYGYVIRMNRADGSYGIANANRGNWVAWGMDAEQVRAFFAGHELERTF
jgi:hypothetical protein